MGPLAYARDSVRPQRPRRRDRRERTSKRRNPRFDSYLSKFAWVRLVVASGEEMAFGNLCSTDE